MKCCKCNRCGEELVRRSYNEELFLEEHQDDIFHFKSSDDKQAYFENKCFAITLGVTPGMSFWGIRSKTDLPKREVYFIDLYDTGTIKNIYHKLY
ncbi:hypothetical protein UFOVP1361_44 [uncultured Caudovirales phage]|uniref:Uncharacterized protein n=1 Tax=uncultured Caudovirales phage TaxID=2100421 RepID=A0A6J5S4D7_9CAUD|nr:hypothetical protein UFOVP1361_44 [uncultured Caudovirales phage]